MTVEIKQLTAKLVNTYCQLIRGFTFDITPTDNSIVTKIVYCRKGYNKGNQGDFPAYKIEFENPQFKLIIPEKNIESMVVETIKKDKKKNTPDFLPELPTKEIITTELPINDNELTIEPAINDKFLKDNELLNKITKVNPSFNTVNNKISNIDLS